ncbi:9624_t:CDS:2 [Gigaspora margarita]|uniref:9624_t:CDS:1 n=1 Tax=Gigaspora margarita TaxID=4874 RepID=A0ABN7V8U4_GIGMA|nr:9624_t:CDS:2 [Gigaspora margarita]
MDLLPAQSFDFIIKDKSSYKILCTKDRKTVLMNYWIIIFKFYRLSRDKLDNIVTKIQTNKWNDDTVEMPFIPNSLLKSIGKNKADDKDE